MYGKRFLFQSTQGEGQVCDIGTGHMLGIIHVRSSRSLIVRLVTCGVLVVILQFVRRQELRELAFKDIWKRPKGPKAVYPLARMNTKRRIQRSDRLVSTMSTLLRTASFAL
jgi:hypothetical protein